jgi:hypothetical protein
MNTLEEVIINYDKLAKESRTKIEKGFSNYSKAEIECEKWALLTKFVSDLKSIKLIEQYIELFNKFTEEFEIQLRNTIGDELTNHYKAASSAVIPNDTGNYSEFYAKSILDAIDKVEANK